MGCLGSGPWEGCASGSGRCTPPGHPPGHTPLVTPPWSHPPQHSLDTSPPLDTHTLPTTVKKRVVCILLECFLVLSSVYLRKNLSHSAPDINRKVYKSCPLSTMTSHVNITVPQESIAVGCVRPARLLTVHVTSIATRCQYQLGAALK